MSGADYFGDEFAINAYMDSAMSVDVNRAKAEHQAIKQAFESAGIKVIQVEPPLHCQDGVYTANWGLCRGGKVVMSSLPNTRQNESPYAEKVLANLGMEIIHLPTAPSNKGESLRFSGQGDALPCGNLLFAGSQYRTDPAAHKFLTEYLGYEVISLQTIPKTDDNNRPVINQVTGWPDSFFYDIDLAIAVLTPNLIAWCPDAFMPESQKIIQNLSIEKIEVSLEEATQGFACNLVSTGETVIMSAHAPLLRAAIESRGLKTLTPEVSELGKGGGYIRCTSLTLDN